MTDHSPRPELLPRRSAAGVTFTFADAGTLNHVAVAGTFNSWDGTAHPLERIAADTWQITLPIAPGRHLYKYVLDDHDWVRDPANPWISEDGQHNSCFTLTEAGELYVRQGDIGPQRPGPLYRDHAATPSPTWLHDAVIYELAAQAFGGFNGIYERLPYLRDLGVNVLWLMPIQPIGRFNRSGSLGDPYAVHDFMAIDPALGSAADLRALVDAAHAHGMRVIYDWTLNRAARDNPLTVQHPEWFQHDAQGRITYAVPNRTAFAGFDFSRPELRRYLIAAMQEWITTYDFDGFRFDDSDLTPLDYLREIRTALTALRPDIALISQSYDELHHLGACDLTYEGGIRELIAQIARGEAHPTALQRYWDEASYSFPRGALRMRWLEEKEQDRAFRAFGRELHAAAATILLTLDGVPFLLMGQEFNEPRWRSWEVLFEPFELEWSAFDEECFAHYKTLIGLRTRHEALRRGEVAFASAGAEQVIRYWRRTPTEQICVTVNLSDAWREPAPHAVPMEALYRHGAEADARGSLAPYGALIERASVVESSFAHSRSHSRSV
jgi:1,4-alpha-glucan branching enzyme